MESKMKSLGPVSFPTFTGERFYMQPFHKGEILPQCMIRWQPTIDRLLQDIDVESEVYLTLDQKRIEPQKTHRRGGVHIDGNWIAASQTHRTKGRHSLGMWDGRGYWGANALKEEAIILASDVYGCDGYLGTWDGIVGEGGDASHQDLSKLQRVALKGGQAYIGNVGFLHESIPQSTAVERSLVRITIPGFVF